MGEKASRPHCIPILAASLVFPTSDSSDIYFQVLIRADRDVYFSPDISDSSSELLYRHPFAILSLRTFRTYIYLRVWKKVYILDNGRGHMYYFVPNKEFEKSVRFVRKPPAIHHRISSLHGKKKRRREGLHSFDLRDALDILMPHHFMGTGLPERRTQQEPSFRNLFTQGRVSGTL